MLLSFFSPQPFVAVWAVNKCVYANCVSFFLAHILLDFTCDNLFVNFSAKTSHKRVRIERKITLRRFNLTFSRLFSSQWNGIITITNYYCCFIMKHRVIFTEICLFLFSVIIIILVAVIIWCDCLGKYFWLTAKDLNSLIANKFLGIFIQSCVILKTRFNFHEMRLKLWYFGLFLRKIFVKSM